MNCEDKIRDCEETWLWSSSQTTTHEDNHYPLRKDKSRVITDQLAIVLLDSKVNLKKESTSGAKRNQLVYSVNECT